MTDLETLRVLFSRAHVEYRENASMLYEAGVASKSVVLEHYVAIGHKQGGMICTFIFTPDGALTGMEIS